MQERVSKQIKLTDGEYEIFTDRSGDSGKPSAKQYLDALLEDYLTSEENTPKAKLSFLAPGKSGSYRTIWISAKVRDLLRTFAESKDVSQNAVLFTVVKQDIANAKGEQHAY